MNINNPQYVLYINFLSLRLTKIVINDLKPLKFKTY